MDAKTVSAQRETPRQEDPRYLPTYDGCYVCGQNHPRGLRIRFYAGADNRVHAQFRPDETLTGYDDVVHGGVISTLLDELIGWSVSLNHDCMAYTAELTVRFSRPLRLGRDYTASAWMGTGRGRYWEASGEIADEQGQIYAKGHGKYFLLSADQTAAVAGKMTYRPGDLRAFHRRE